MKQIALLIIALVLACGCTSSVPGPQAAPEPVAQVPPGDPQTAVAPGVAVAPTETPGWADYWSNDKTVVVEPDGSVHSIYMYSTARGLKYHPAGFVCTDPAGQTFIGGNEGMVGIWCER